MSADKETLAVYAARTESYLAIEPSEAEAGALKDFLRKLPPGAHVLDIGCGPGSHSVLMKRAGFAVTAWDASPEFVEIARGRGIDAHLRGFDLLVETDAFDAIWASFSLLHTPKAEHATHIGAMARALRPGGLLYLGMKIGEGEARDALGRFYSYVTRAELEGLVQSAGLTPIDCTLGEAAGLAGTIDPFILLTSRRDA